MARIISHKQVVVHVLAWIKVYTSPLSTCNRLKNGFLSKQKEDTKDEVNDTCDYYAMHVF